MPHVLVLIVLLLSASSKAQIFRTLKVVDQFEISVGPNHYRIQSLGSPSDKLLGKPGFTSSLYFHFEIKPQMDISLRLFYDSKGYILKYPTNYWDNSTGSTLSGEIKAETFLQDTGLAVLAKFKIKETNLFFDAGPFVSYFIKGRDEQTFSWNHLTQIIFIDSGNRFSGGLSFSIGYYLSIRDSSGLSFRIIENMELVESTTHTISIQAGFKF